jgi:multiple sugar transport system permease protein
LLGLNYYPEEQEPDIVKFTAEKHTDEGAMMAVAAIASIPILIVFFKLSKYFLSGADLYSSRKG